MREIIRILYSIYHWLLNLIGAFKYHFPSRKLTIIGITGTKGKSTTLALLSDILEEAGHKTSLISSLTKKIGIKIEKNNTGNSMPGRFFLQKFLSDSVDAGCDVALIEVTSQGVVQYRHKFIFWDRVVFLNIHPEHIEAHGSFEKYLEAKLNFFRDASSSPDSKTPQFFVNSQDAHADDFAQAVYNFPVKRFSPGLTDALKLKLPISLKADFLKTNIAAAIAVARSLDVDDKTIKKAIEGFGGIEGRMDVVVSKPFKVVVDYAHTPDSLEAVYEHLSRGLKKGRLLCVLGSAGGGRDKWKRPVFGSLAAKYCGFTFLTNEDPYDENPEEIIDSIESGYLKAKGAKKNIEKITDRRKAILGALSMAKSGDVVICTGKGSETSIHIAGRKTIPWSEKGIIEEILNGKNIDNRLN